MNDYSLINALLEDGSESSLLKLKVILDKTNFNLYRIKPKNRLKLVILFKDFFTNSMYMHNLIMMIPAYDIIAFATEFEDLI